MPQHPLEIIYDDEHIVVVNKPSGLLSTPGRGPQNQICATSSIASRFQPEMEYTAVHRLDMDTSGILLIALTRLAYKALSQQFEQRLVHKQYVAVLDGIHHDPHGHIELPFRLDTQNRPHQIHDPIHGKLGITDWQKIEDSNGRSRILFTPLTGRTHQLRLHSAHPLGLGIPIVGDTLYGNGIRHGELLLHASFLSFTHPTSGELMTIHCHPRF